MFITPLVPRAMAMPAMTPGVAAEFDYLITEEEHRTFTTLLGDLNPIHCDATYAAGTAFGRPICHGLQLAALFSTLSGMLLPGQGSLTLEQHVAFKSPVFPGERFTVRGRVTRVMDGLGVVELATEIVDADGRIRVSGRKLVQAPEFVARSSR